MELISIIGLQKVLKKQISMYAIFQDMEQCLFIEFNGFGNQGRFILFLNQTIR